MSSTLTAKHPNEQLATKFAKAWEGSIPNIQFITQPMPDAIQLNLTGSGVASTMDIDAFEASLLRDYQGQRGAYYAYVDGYHGSDNDADIYQLVGWEVLQGSKCAVHTVIMYYRPVSEIETVRKHMPQMLEAYMEEAQYADNTTSLGIA